MAGKSQSTAANIGDVLHNKIRAIKNSISAMNFMMKHVDIDMVIICSSKTSIYSRLWLLLLSLDVYLNSNVRLLVNKYFVWVP
jgi:hypothetical protein